MNKYKEWFTTCNVCGGELHRYLCDRFIRICPSCEKDTIEQGLIKIVDTKEELNE